MRFPKFLIGIALVGVSILATTYILHSDNDDNAPAVTAREQDLQQEIDRLRKTNDTLSADLERVQLNRDQPAAGNTAPPKQDMTQTAAAPPPALMAPGESLTDDAPPRAAAHPIPISMNRPTKAQLEAANPTPEQSAIYKSMNQRLDGPSFVKTLNLSERSQMEEMKTLPEPLRQALLATAAEKYNRGEVDEKTFLSGMAGYSQ